MDLDQPAYLLDIVEVAKEKRIRCQADGCGHAVYARIHVVLVGGQFQVLGGDCFQRLYGGSLSGAASFYGGSVGSPTKLDDEMRLLLETNTADFIERLEARRLELEARAAKSARTSTTSAAPTPPQAPAPTVERFVFSVDDPSTVPYEGPSMLKWKWVQDRERVAACLTQASQAPGPAIGTVVTCYRSFNLNHSPYQFALAVELKHFLPKGIILRSLHQLGLIEQG